MKKPGLALVASVLVPAACATASDSQRNTTQLTITEDGVGPIAAATGFDQGAIQKRLPDFIVEAAFSSSEGEKIPVLLVMQQGTPLAMIVPDHQRQSIVGIEVISDRVANAFGPTVGERYQKVYGNLVDASCQAGMEEWSGFVICQDPKTSHVRYVFSGPSPGPDGTLPDLEYLRDFSIREIVWKP